MSNYHIPVLFTEVLEGLRVKSGNKYIDATLGGGGHARGILEKGGSVLGIDQDEDAVNFVKQNQDLRFKIHPSGKLGIGDLRIAKGNFRDIESIARENEFTSVAGVLFDLGVSSRQLQAKNRGFSFANDAELDMRMDRDLGVKAKDLVNVLPKKELTELFTRYGEERNAWQIAGKIVQERAKRPITSTTQLAALIGDKRVGEIHPATRVFQALRIAVNDELKSLEEALPQALKLLAAGGRIAIISFHSLEDRIVKQAFLSFKENGKGNIITKKPIIPSEIEQQENRRSRSSKLRIFEKQ